MLQHRVWSGLAILTTPILFSGGAVAQSGGHAEVVSHCPYNVWCRTLAPQGDSDWQLVTKDQINTYQYQTNETRVQCMRNTTTLAQPHRLLYSQLSFALAKTDGVMTYNYNTANVDRNFDKPPFVDEGTSVDIVAGPGEPFFHLGCYNWTCAKGDDGCQTRAMCTPYTCSTSNTVRWSICGGSVPLNG